MPVNEQDLRNAAKVSAEVAATAAIEAFNASRPAPAELAAPQIVIQKTPNIQPFVPSGDPLSQGLELLDYIDQYKWATKACKITAAEDLQSHLLSLGGPKIREINQSIRDDEVEGEDVFKKLVKKLKIKFITVDQQQAARHQLNSTQQQPNENFIDFYLRLKRLMEICQYTNLNQDQKDELMKDVLLANTTNTKIQTHCYTHNSSLKEVYQYASTVLNVKAQTKAIQNESKVNRVIHNRNNNTNNNNPKCGRCGMDSKHPVCFARNKHCLNCGLLGHYSRVCKAPRQQQQQQLPQQQQSFQQPRQQQQQRNFNSQNRYPQRGRFQSRGQNRYPNNSRFSRQVQAGHVNQYGNNDQYDDQADDHYDEYDNNGDNEATDEVLESFSRHISINPVI